MKIRHPELEWRGNTPVAKGYNDIYYSPDNAIGEVRHNFVSTIASAFGVRKIIVIGETGFGTGLNFLVTWHDWLQKRREGDQLIFVSTEAHPLHKADLKRALSAFQELASLAEQLINAWPVGIPGPHRRFFDVKQEQGKVELWVFYGEAQAELAKQDFQADAWYFDGFNPAGNKALWSPRLIKECARLMAPGATGGTFTVASGVRTVMGEAGLKAEKVLGFGRKRHCLRIRKSGQSKRNDLKKIARYSIVGDGIAAASLAWASRSRGYECDVWFGFKMTEPASHRASGNPAALVNFKPTKSPQEPSNRLLAASLAHIQPLYETLWLPGRGTDKPAQNSSQQEYFRLAFEAMGWSENCLRYESQTLSSPLSGYVKPQDVLAFLFAASAPRLYEGGCLKQAIHANAFGAIYAVPSLAALLKRNIGQVDLFAEGPALKAPVTYGGYITPQFDRYWLAGSTYERDLDWKDANLLKPKQTATDEIVEKAFRAGLSLPSKAQESFVSARAFGKDHRPIVGQTAEGAWVLTGLGSRGFLTAPLLAEILLDEMEGRAAAGLPIYDFASCVHPSRFSK